MKRIAETALLDLVRIELVLFVFNACCRRVIRIAYTYRKTNRERRAFYAEGNWKLRWLMPYKEMMQHCYAPRHMRIFQVFRRINWVLAFMGVILYIGRVGLPQWDNVIRIFYRYVVIPYVFPLLVYSCTIGPRKGPKKHRGDEFNTCKHP